MCLLYAHNACIMRVVCYTMHLLKQHTTQHMQKQKQVNYKNVTRYLNTAATQVQLAQHFYKQSKNTQHSAAYIQFALSNMQAITKKYAHIVTQQQQIKNLIVAQTMQSNYNYNANLSAVTNFAYILQAYKNMQITV